MVVSLSFDAQNRQTFQDLEVLITNYCASFYGALNNLQRPNCLLKHLVTLSKYTYFKKMIPSQFL